MDPRFLRLERALRGAVLLLSGQQCVQEVSVAALCRQAGVTRDTFYRHARSPLDLLAATLRDEILDVLSPDDDPLEPGRDAFAAGERALLGHVAHRADIYRHSLRPRLLAPLRANLTDVIEASLASYLALHPDVRPEGIDADDSEAAAMLVAYGAAGTVGAIEAWVRGADLDVERGVELMLHASPEFWFSSPKTI